MNRPPTPHRRWLWLLLVPILLIGIIRLSFDVDVLNLLPDGQPAVRGLKLYQENFSNARELIITLKGVDPQETESAARILAGHLRSFSIAYSKVHWQPPWKEHPAQAGELIAYLWLNQPPELFREFARRLDGDSLGNTLSETRERLATSLSPGELARLSYDPLQLTRLPGESTPFPGADAADPFTSTDGTFRLVIVEASGNLPTYREISSWLKDTKVRVREVVNSGNCPTVQVGYTGGPAFVSDIAGGMERDMTWSVTGTMLIIAALFWWVHRRIRPLLWLLALLALILALTMAVGGLIFGTLNVVSLGFAAILLGLAVDYGLVLYQEARSQPIIASNAANQKVMPAILWSAATTAGAFALLNLSGLPGLAQLGSLVAIGVSIAAAVMLLAYLPGVRMFGRSASAQPTETSRAHPATHLSFLAFGKTNIIAWIVTGAVAVAGIVNIFVMPPRFDHTAGALRPKSSPAYSAIGQIQAHMGRPEDQLWILVSGNSAHEVAVRLDQSKSALEKLKAAGFVTRFTLPDRLWPNPENQAANKPVAGEIVRRANVIRESTLASGFTPAALGLAGAVFQTWETALLTTNVFWPTNDASNWVIDKVTAGHPSAWTALGSVDPAPGKMHVLADVWPEELAASDVVITGWDILGASLFDIVKADLRQILLPMTALLVTALGLAYRRATEVVLSFLTLLVSATGLLLIMALFGWAWNLMSMMAIPLLLGTGVDYSIHMQLALRRHNGDRDAAHRVVGRALLLCGCTTAAAFGSLSLSNNAGLASLGQACAAGIVCSMATAVFLLPAWWQSTTGMKPIVRRSA